MTAEFRSGSAVAGVPHFLDGVWRFSGREISRSPEQSRRACRFKVLALFDLALGDSHFESLIDESESERRPRFEGEREHVKFILVVAQRELKLVQVYDYRHKLNYLKTRAVPGNKNYCIAWFSEKHAWSSTCE